MLQSCTANSETMPDARAASIRCSGDHAAGFTVMPDDYLHGLGRVEETRPGVLPANIEVAFKPYPRPAGIFDLASAAAGGALNLLLGIALLYPTRNIVAAVVQEKELRLREGMKIFGLQVCGKSPLALSCMSHHISIRTTFLALGILHVYKKQQETEARVCQAQTKNRDGEPKASLGSRCAEGLPLPFQQHGLCIEPGAFVELVSRAAKQPVQLST